MTVSGEILERLARLEEAWGETPARLAEQLNAARAGEAPDARRFAGPMEGMATVRQLMPAGSEAEARLRGGMEADAGGGAAAFAGPFSESSAPEGRTAAGLFPTWPQLGAGNGAGGLSAAGGEGERVPELLERIAELLESIAGKLDRAGPGGGGGPGAAAGNSVWSASWTADELDQGESFPAASPSVNVSTRGGGRGAGGYGFGSAPVRAPSDFLEPERRRPS